jgi:TatD DNase family protein
MGLVDSHCHLDDSQFDDDQLATVDRALAAGVEVMVAIGTGNGPPNLDGAIQLADKYDPVFATVGIHPEHAPRATREHFVQLADLSRHPKCVAVGEIGLDYHWQPHDRKVQEAVFVSQMEIARAASKPIVIHTRDAWADTMSLLVRHWVGSGLPCVMHCFTGGDGEAREALDLGFYLSFAGIVTYPKATDLHAAAKLVPLDRMLIETDAPYLAPIPHRGKRNEPAFVAHTAAHLAELRGEEVSRLSQAVRANVRSVFGIE